MKIKLIDFGAVEKSLVPVRAHYNDAGLDCYAQEGFVLYPKGGAISIVGENNGDISINPNVHIQKVRLGFGLEVPDGYMATIRPRSSMNALGILTQIGTIDSGYRGEISAIFVNLSTKEFHFEKGDKICQIVIEPVVLAEPVLELNNDRGTGGFGSTGK